MISIRRMRTDQLHAAEHHALGPVRQPARELPVFPGDTRITVIHVPDLLPDQEIPKEKLIEKLTEEGPHFMYSLMNVELPEPSGRLRLPIVVTDSKVRSEEENRTSLEEFIDDCCYGPLAC